MKTETLDRNVTTDTAARSTFKIRDEETAKVIGMLISGLYSNKPQSITREIWSNALDGHTYAGTPERPFDITFPSVFDPTFRVRDYGPGMSHDDIMELYTSVGYSTKEDSNAEVGKWGIGSKSPFSYTDTFSVSCYKDGKVRHYTAIIEEGGIPAMHLMGEDDTDEENGIEVSFPVSPGDVSAFRKAAQRVSYGFDVKPNVLISDDDATFDGWVDPPVISQGKGWKLLDGKLEGYGGTSYAHMGCVLYPIDIESVDGLTIEARELLNTTLIVRFDIGELAIIPSREGLSYGRNEPTSAAIVARAEEIVAEMTDELLAEYENCETYWAACVMHAKHMGLNLPSAIKQVIGNKARWQGRPLKTKLSLKAPPREVQYRVDMVQQRYLPRLALCELSGGTLTKNKHVKYDHKQTDKAVMACDGVVIVIEDTTLPHKEKAKRVGPRMSLFRDENKDWLEHVIWIKWEDKGKQESDDLLWILDTFEGVEIINMVDLPEPERDGYGGGGQRSPTRVRVLKSGWANNMYADMRDLSDEEMQAGGFYVKTVRNEEERPAGYNAALSVWDAFKACGAHGGKPAYAVPKTLWKRFEGKPQWKELYAAADEYWAANDFTAGIKEWHVMRDVYHNTVLDFMNDVIDTSRLADTSDGVAMVNFFDRVKTFDYELWDNRDTLGRALNKEVTPDEDEHDLQVEAKYHVEIAELNYPLLHRMSRQTTASSDLVDMATDYVYMCDAKQESARAKAA